MLTKLSLIAALSLATGSLPVFAGSDAKEPAPLAPQPETPLGVTLGVGWDSDYVFRGLFTARDLVTTTLDYALPLDDVFSLNLNTWYGSSAGDQAVGWAGGGSYEELRLAGSVLAKLGPLTAGVKYTHFFYWGNAGHFVKDVNEEGVVLGYALAGFDLGFYGAYDNTARGYYFEYSVARKIQINDWLSIVPEALISNGSHYYGVNGGNNVLLDLGVPVRLSKNATLTPYVAENLPIDSLKSSGERDRFFGGVRLTVTF